MIKPYKDALKIIEHSENEAYKNYLQLLKEEIIRYDPDVVCLQEVDHFKMLEMALGSIGYHGR